MAKQPKHNKGFFISAAISTKETRKAAKRSFGKSKKSKSKKKSKGK